MLQHSYLRSTLRHRFWGLQAGSLAEDTGGHELAVAMRCSGQSEYTLLAD
jgi:hypothetical protein